MSLLAAPDPAWPEIASEEIDRWHAGVSDVIAVHHIGSTSVPGLPAKPIIDLLPVFASLETMEDARADVEHLGFEWLGEFGLPGRRYARKSDPESGRRLVQAHCYVDGDDSIRRHIAFRDALRDSGMLRAGYTAVKAACAARHPDGGAAYGDCKSGWIDKTEARAVRRAR